MKQEKIWQDFAALPPELQRQVVDFIAFLRTRSGQTTTTKRTKRIPLRDQPFIGMWRDREDMEDSTAWVRKTRQSEWMKPGD